MERSPWWVYLNPHTTICHRFEHTNVFSEKNWEAPNYIDQRKFTNREQHLNFGYMNSFAISFNPIAIAICTWATADRCVSKSGATITFCGWKCRKPKFASRMLSLRQSLRTRPFSCDHFWLVEYDTTVPRPLRFALSVTFDPGCKILRTWNFPHALSA